MLTDVPAYYCEAQSPQQTSCTSTSLPLLGRKPRPPMLVIPDSIPPPPLTPVVSKPNPIFRPTQQPSQTQPMLRPQQQPESLFLPLLLPQIIIHPQSQPSRRRRQLKIWDLLPTPKGDDDVEARWKQPLSKRSDVSRGAEQRPSPVVAEKCESVVAFPVRPSDRFDFTRSTDSKSLPRRRLGVEFSSTTKTSGDGCFDGAPGRDSGQYSLSVRTSPLFHPPGIAVQQRVTEPTTERNQQQKQQQQQHVYPFPHPHQQSASAAGSRIEVVYGSDAHVVTITDASTVDASTVDASMPIPDNSISQLRADDNLAAASRPSDPYVCGVDVSLSRAWTRLLSAMAPIAEAASALLLLLPVAATELPASFQLRRTEGFRATSMTRGTKGKQQGADVSPATVLEYLGFSDVSDEE